MAEESCDLSQLFSMEEGLMVGESQDYSQLSSLEERLMATLEDSNKDVRMATRVMVVDSDKASLKEMESLMVQCDYDVTPVDNPIAAIQMLKERKCCFDLVVSNIFMPQMDSLELLDIATNNLGIPVVLVSDNSEDQATFHRETLGRVKDVIVKPLRPLVLMNMWRHVVRPQKFKLGKRERDPLHKDTIAEAEEQEKFKLRKTDPHDESSMSEDEEGTACKQTNSGEAPAKSQKWKKRFAWTTELKKKFAFAVDQLGFENATPSKILEIMGVTELTRKQIGSRLQKHRIYRRKCEAEGREHKDLSVKGGFGCSTAPGLASQVVQTLNPTVVTEPKRGSLGPYTSMPSYYSSFKTEDRRGLVTYGLMQSTDPASIIGRAPSFVQERRNRVNENVLQNPSIPSIMQQQGNQLDDSILRHTYVARSGYDPTPTMWSSSPNLKPGDYEPLPLHGYAFDQQAANHDQLNFASTSHFDVAPSSYTGLMLGDYQFDGQHASTSEAMSHNMHVQSTSVPPLAALETGCEGIDQIFQCSQNELAGLSSATQPCASSFETDLLQCSQNELTGLSSATRPCASSFETDLLQCSQNELTGLSSATQPCASSFETDLLQCSQNELAGLSSATQPCASSFETDLLQCSQNELAGLSSATQPCASSFETAPMDSTHMSLGMQDMPVTPLPAQMQNLGDLYGNSNSYLDNMNTGLSSFPDLERMLDLIVPPESQFQLSDLDCLFPVNDQDYGHGNGSVPPDQPNQVFDMAGSQSFASLAGAWYD